MNSPSNALEWLLSDAVSDQLAEIQDWINEGLALNSQVKRLRNAFPADQASMLMEVAQTRHRAKSKFSRANRMFFTKRGYEQATDEWIGQYKAERFNGCTTIADLCCGIGGDAISLALKAPTHLVDSDDQLCEMARHNARVYGNEELITNHIAAEEFSIADVQAWHLDPDRRVDNRRTIQTENFSPELDAIRRMLAKNPNAAIKSAPVSPLPEAWHGQCEQEWIGRDGETKQQVLWFGNLTEKPGTKRVTLIQRETIDQPASLSFDELDQDFASVSKQPQRYLIEPHSVILAAQVLSSFAVRHELNLLSHGHTLLTSDGLVDSPFATCFEVEETIPMQKRPVENWLEQKAIDQLEMKWNGVRADEFRFRWKRAKSSDLKRTVFFTRLGEKRIAILTRRCT